MDVKAYLDRIGVRRPVSPTLDFLKHLQEQHLLHVPFENLDIHWNRRIHLHPETLFSKIVYHRRGGLCYELNGAFGPLLQELGYRVSWISGRVRTADGGFGPEFDHMALIVQLEEPWLVDVGFGDSSRQPLPLNGEKKEDISGSYRVTQLRGTDTYTLEKKTKNRWTPEYRFTTKPRKLRDFAIMCDHQQTSVTSVFQQELILTRGTPTGRISLSNQELTLTEQGEKHKFPIRTLEERNHLMWKHFGIQPEGRNNPVRFGASSTNEGP